MYSLGLGLSGLRLRVCGVWLEPLRVGRLWGLCRENMAYIRQSRPDSGLGIQVEVLKTSCPHSLGSGSHFGDAVLGFAAQGYGP